MNTLGLLRCLALACALAGSMGAAASAQDITCSPPAIADYDADGNPYCAEPNVNCYGDYPPEYAGSGQWVCGSIAEIQAELRRKAGPQISCPQGAVTWDAAAADWRCEVLSECEICKRCFDYVELAKKQCVQKSRALARAKCNGSYGSTWRGERVVGEIKLLGIPMSRRTCETKKIQDEATGKIDTIQTNCSGPAIDECVEGWAVNHPGEDAGTSSSASVAYKVGAKGGAKILGIGVEVSGGRATQDTQGESYSASWGGGKGFLAACDEAADKVASVCADCSQVCGDE